jgi:hypothetical protein
MTARQMPEQILLERPEDRVGEVLDFARLLNMQEEREAWSALGRRQLATATVSGYPSITL